MRRVRVALRATEDRSYDILIGADTISRLGPAVAARGAGRRALIVADQAVVDAWAPVVASSLHAAGIRTHLVWVPSGEASKSLAQASVLYDAALQSGLDRSGWIVALGGGVVGDLAGFVAATYMRGVPFVQVPTTLLSQLDASVGGKVAVDHPKGKNLIGAFHQPRLVWIDVRTLDSLPIAELRSGLVEAVKHGLIADARYYRFVRRNAEAILAREEGALTRLVAGSCRIKAAVVAADEREETGQRMLLNLGHTLGHAIEAVAGYGNIRHGEAVAIGLCAAGRLALRRGLWSRRWQAELEGTLQGLGLPVRVPDLAWPELLAAMRHDKKVSQGRMRWVLPQAPGRAAVYEDIPVEDVAAVVRELGATD